MCCGFQLRDVAVEPTASVDRPANAPQSAKKEANVAALDVPAAAPSDSQRPSSDQVTNARCSI